VTWGTADDIAARVAEPADGGPGTKSRRAAPEDGS
jgi:hypothetical protein